MREVVLNGIITGVVIGILLILADIRAVANTRHKAALKEIHWKMTFLKEMGFTPDTESPAANNELQASQELYVALQPFLSFGITDDGYNLSEAFMRDRICDWFGPSEFEALRRTYKNWLTRRADATVMDINT